MIPLSVHALPPGGVVRLSHRVISAEPRILVGRCSPGSSNVATTATANAPLFGSSFLLGAAGAGLRARRIVVRASSVTVDEEVVDRIFDRLDLDGNGVLDHDELKKGLAMLLADQKITDAEVQKMIRVFDENFDGQIQRQEWREGAVKAAKLWQTLHPDNRELFQDLSLATLAELEVEYIDAIFNYFKGSPVISDDNYEALREELQWQGSVFPSLSTDEIKWLEAELAFYRGEPIMSDEEFQKLAKKVSAGGRRTELTAFLYYVKGKYKLSYEEFKDEKLRNSMNALGSEVDRKGAAGPMFADSSDLEPSLDQQALFFASLGFFPFLLSFFTFGFFLVIVSGWGTAFKLWPFTLAVGLAGAFLLTQQLLTFLDLQNSEILCSTCPACGVRQNHFLNDTLPSLVYKHKCVACGHEVQIDLEKRRSEPVGTPEVVAAGFVGRRSFGTSSAFSSSTANHAP